MGPSVRTQKNSYCTTYRVDEGVIGTWAERSAQSNMCPRILVAGSALVDEESGRTAHRVSSKHGEELEHSNIVISIAPLWSAVYDGMAGEVIVGFPKRAQPVRNVN